MNVAYLGMGIMGSAMAANLIKAGHSVTVYNRTAAKCEPLRQLGATVAATPAEAAAGKEAILTCVDDTQDVEEVIFGKQGLAHGLPKPAATPPVMVLDHATISPEAEAAFGERLAKEYGAVYIDAPITGGDIGARAGTLSIMCGGAEEAFERARPLLEAMGKTIVHIGPRIGDGQRAKLINQLVIAINCMATTEGMRFGEAMGVDLDKVMQAIGAGAAGSWNLVNLGPRFVRRDFAPGFRLRHLQKDAQYCIEALKSVSAEMPDKFPGIQLALSLIRRSVAAGNGDDNIIGMAKIFLDNADCGLRNEEGGWRPGKDNK